MYRVLGAGGRLLGGVIAILLAMPAYAGAGPLTWSGLEHIAPGAFNAIACPSTALCVAVGNHGRAALSTDPAGQVWSLSQIDGASRVISVSCPTVSFCAATDNHARVLTSNPHVSGAWPAVAIDPGRWITGISCVSKKLCVAVDRRGGVISTSNAEGGPHAWKRVQASNRSLTSISCPSARLCLATESSGKVIESHKPLGGPGSWYERTIEPAGYTVLRQIDCPNVHFCAAAASTDVSTLEVLASTNPAGKGRWAGHDLNSYPHEGNVSAGVSCSSAGFCGAFSRSQSNSDQVYATTAPLSAWPTGAYPAPDNYSGSFMGIACAASSLCVIVDNLGNVVTGT